MNFGSHSVHVGSDTNGPGEAAFDFTSDCAIIYNRTSSLALARVSSVAKLALSSPFVVGVREILEKSFTQNATDCNFLVLRLPKHTQPFAAVLLPKSVDRAVISLIVRHKMSSYVVMASSMMSSRSTLLLNPIQVNI